MTDPNVSLLASSEYRHLPGGFHLSTLEEGGERPLTRQHHSTGRRRGTPRCQTSLALLGVEHHTRNQPPGKLPAWSCRVGAEHPSTGVTPGGETPGTMRGTLPASPTSTPCNALAFPPSHVQSRKSTPPSSANSLRRDLFWNCSFFFFSSLLFFPVF